VNFRVKCYNTDVFGLVVIPGIEDIPVLSYEAVMQHERKFRFTSLHIGLTLNEFTFFCGIKQTVVNMF